MKAVIFAGGFGTRLSEETHLIPKPMVRIAGREVRHKKDMSDRIMPSRIAVSSRMVTVASMGILFRLNH